MSLKHEITEKSPSGDQDHNHDEKHKTKEVLLKEGQEDGPINDGDQDESATKLVQQIESANSNDNDNDNQEFMNIFRRVLAKELKLSPIHEVEEEEGYLASQSASAASDNSDSATSEDEETTCTREPKLDSCEEQYCAKALDNNSQLSLSNSSGGMKFYKLKWRKKIKGIQTKLKNLFTKRKATQEAENSLANIYKKSSLRERLKRERKYNKGLRWCPSIQVNETSKKKQEESKAHVDDYPDIF